MLISHAGYVAPQPNAALAACPMLFGWVVRLFSAAGALELLLYVHCWALGTASQLVHNSRRGCQEAVQLASM